MKSCVALVGLACLVIASPAGADGEFKGFAKPFSADVRENADQYKVECAGTRCRLSSPQKKAAGTMIADYRSNTSYIVLDESKQYFENKTSRSTEYFDPCARMKVMQADMKKGGVAESALQVPAGYARMTEEQFLKRTVETSRRK